MTTEIKNIRDVLVMNSIVTVVSFILFYFAVRARCVSIAPRCAARSPNTIYNPVARRKTKQEKREKETYDGGGSGGGGEGNNGSDNSDDHVQFRGGPMFGWIPWTLSMSYEKMLEGIPGTGTRKMGMEGKMLNLNLDNIVFLRFHGKSIVQF